MDRTFNSFARIISPNGICCTITTKPHDVRIKSDDEPCRVRLLTEREAWRLMGFSDEDFDKLEGFSRSRLRMFTGNSIVVTVLEAIFKRIYIDQTFVKQPKLTDY